MMLPASQILVPLLLQDFDINWKPSSPRGSKRVRLREFRHCIPQDGHDWLKYGQKDITAGRFSRHYFRCSHSDNGTRCPARRVVDVHKQFGQPGTSAPPPRVTYSGEHSHAQPGSSEEHRAVRLDAFRTSSSNSSAKDGRSCDNSGLLTPTTPSSSPLLLPPLSSPLSPQFSSPLTPPLSPLTPLSPAVAASVNVVPAPLREEAAAGAWGTVEFKSECVGLATGKRKRQPVEAGEEVGESKYAGKRLQQQQQQQQQAVDNETVTSSDDSLWQWLPAMTATEWASASSLFDTPDLGPLKAAPIESPLSDALAAPARSAAMTWQNLDVVDASAPLSPLASESRPQCCNAPCTHSQQSLLAKSARRSATDGFAPLAGSLLVIAEDEAGVIQVVMADGIQRRQEQQADLFCNNDSDRCVPELLDFQFWAGVDGAARDAGGGAAADGWSCELDAAYGGCDLIGDINKWGATPRRQPGGVEVPGLVGRCNSLVISEDSLGMVQVRSGGGW
ncbi:hypothetical protein CLOM_g3655 [Closterium sp. NIES-68]|nr:hypothetical protein CLOM_g3655 [Closterium sp. NIES-68]GJP71999.1 hypothetical protein CLOP_g2776 [Closterium sp. NIES-67]